MTEHKPKLDSEARKLIFPEAHETIEEIFEILDNYPGAAGSDNYSHCIGMLSAVAHANCEEFSFEEQKRRLREFGLNLIEKYGDGILGVMKSELREALGFKDE